MAGLSINTAEIKANIGMVMGLARDPDNWGETTISDVDRILRSGRRRFLSAHDWRFLKTIYEWTTVAPTTRLVTKSGASLTSTNGNWPVTSLVTQQHVAINGSVYRIKARTSDTVLELYDTTLTLTDPVEATVYVTRYALPDYLCGIQGPVTREGNECLRETTLLPEYELRRLHSGSRVNAGAPTAFTTTVLTDSFYYGNSTLAVEVYPLPDKAYPLRTTAQIILDDASSPLSETSAVMHPLFSEVFMECILAQAESYFNNQADGPHMVRFAQLLPEAIRMDKKLEGSRRLLPRPDSATLAMRDPLYELRIAPVEFL